MMAITSETDPLAWVLFCWSFPVGVLVELAMTDDGEPELIVPELVELSGDETVPVTVESLSG